MPGTFDQALSTHPHYARHDGAAGPVIAPKTFEPLVASESAIAMREALVAYSESLVQKIARMTTVDFSATKEMEKAQIITAFVMINDPATDPDAYALSVKAMVAYRESKKDQNFLIYASDGAHTFLKPSALNHLIP